MAPVVVNPLIHVGAAHQQPPVVEAKTIIDHYRQGGVIKGEPQIFVKPVSLPPSIIHNQVVVSGEPQPLPEVRPEVITHPDYTKSIVTRPSVTLHPNIPEPTVIVEPIVRLHQGPAPGSIETLMSSSLHLY